MSARPPIWRGWVAAVIGVLVLGLTGCTETPTVSRSNVKPTETTSTAPDPGPRPTDDLAALKKAAAIEDCPTSDAQVDPVREGLPDVTLSCLGGGREVRLAGLRGRPMIINVWAQWCVPCREEAPFLADVATVNTSDLAILGINFQDDNPVRALEFAQVASWHYPQLEDTEDAIKAPLQLVGMPQTFFVRADGTIAHRQVRPFTSAEEIRTAARQYLDVAL